MERSKEKSEGVFEVSAREVYPPPGKNAGGEVRNHPRNRGNRPVNFTQFNANAMRYYIPFIIKAENNTRPNDGETIDIKGLTGQGEEMINKIMEAVAGLIRARIKTATR
ncbi:hypothetical protein C922_04694 [Plasmodium inui San Antonio 1]|uniref:Uncharacterized protein n=1 Tax=Plasmodium inui San Antonio 1 TaxID=1237626 RepID=W6ZVZ7_9APIC|nr:hypothetical protein C922_04694 [Plasmodium inui San Antonio 1]EUD64962.1 hypothetical protein C922_04694 [Plasmodium inui San Antonio 1]